MCRWVLPWLSLGVGAGVFLVVSIVQSTLAHAAGPPGDAKARELAEQALKGYKNVIRATDFGFKSHQELEESTITDFVRIYRLDASVIAQGPNTIREAMYDTGLIDFVVASSGRPITRLTMKQSGDTLSRVGFGGDGAGLAWALNFIPDQLRSSVRMVRLGPAEFLYAADSDNEFLVYLGPRPIGNVQAFQLYSWTEIRRDLQVVASQMIQNRYTDAGIGGGVIKGRVPDWMVNLAIVLLGGSVLAGGVYVIRRFGADGRR